MTAFAPKEITALNRAFTTAMQSRPQSLEETASALWRAGALCFTALQGNLWVCTGNVGDDSQPAMEARANWPESQAPSASPSGLALRAVRGNEAVAECHPETGYSRIALPICQGETALGVWEWSGNFDGKDPHLRSVLFLSTEWLAARLIAARAEARVKLQDKQLALHVHELKTPMTTLLLHLQRLRRAISKDVQTASTDSVSEVVSICETQCRRLVSLAHELLKLNPEDDPLHGE